MTSEARAPAATRPSVTMHVTEQQAAELCQLSPDGLESAVESAVTALEGSGPARGAAGGGAVLAVLLAAARAASDQPPLLA